MLAVLPIALTVLLGAEPFFEHNGVDSFIYLGYTENGPDLVDRYGYTYYAVRFGSSCRAASPATSSVRSRDTSLLRVCARSRDGRRALHVRTSPGQPTLPACSAHLLPRQPDLPPGTDGDERRRNGRPLPHCRAGMPADAINPPSLHVPPPQRSLPRDSASTRMRSSVALLVLPLLLLLGLQLLRREPGVVRTYACVATGSHRGHVARLRVPLACIREPQLPRSHSSRWRRRLGGLKEFFRSTSSDWLQITPYLVPRPDHDIASCRCVSFSGPAAIAKGGGRR